MNCRWYLTLRSQTSKGTFWNMHHWTCQPSRRLSSRFYSPWSTATNDALCTVTWSHKTSWSTTTLRTSRYATSGLHAVLSCRWRHWRTRWWLCGSDRLKSSWGRKGKTWVWTSGPLAASWLKWLTASHCSKEIRRWTRYSRYSRARARRITPLGLALKISPTSKSHSLSGKLMNTSKTEFCHS